MNAGDTFLVPGLDDHLWLVISDPQLDKNQVVVVSFVSWQERYEQSCVVEAGEHPFVRHRTCVAYSSARVVDVQRLDTLAGANKLTLKAPLSSALLARIRESAEV